MSDRVYTQEEITLENYETGDEIDLTLRPLPIARQRRFHKAWSNITSIDYESEEDLDKNRDKEYDILIESCGIALEPQMRKHVKDSTGKESKTFGAQGKISSDYKSLLEEYLDDETIRKILDVCGGISLPDPKETRKALLQQQMQQEE